MLQSRLLLYRKAQLNSAVISLVSPANQRVSLAGAEDSSECFESCNPIAVAIVWCQQRLPSLSVTIVVMIIMISRPANNKYWGAEPGVCILYQSPRLWPLYLWEETSVSEICGSCNCTPRCAKWAVTRQEGSGLLTWLLVFLSPLLSLHSATCFLSMLGDFGD